MTIYVARILCFKFAYIKNCFLVAFVLPKIILALLQIQVPTMSFLDSSPASRTMKTSRFLGKSAAQFSLSLNLSQFLSSSSGRSRVTNRRSSVPNRNNFSPCLGIYPKFHRKIVDMPRFDQSSLVNKCSVYAVEITVES